MENIFVEFLPPWVETGLQPAFYDKESGTVLQQTARMYARVNMLIRMFNKLSKETTQSFNELYNYVHDYFDNLDVQEEVNKKLELMVKDGTIEAVLQQLLGIYDVYNFHTLMATPYYRASSDMWGMQGGCVLPSGVIFQCLGESSNKILIYSSDGTLLNSVDVDYGHCNGVTYNDKTNTVFITSTQSDLIGRYKIFEVDPLTLDNVNTFDCSDKEFPDEPYGITYIKEDDTYVFVNYWRTSGKKYIWKTDNKFNVISVKEINVEVRSTSNIGRFGNYLAVNSISDNNVMLFNYWTLDFVKQVNINKIVSDCWNITEIEWFDTRNGKIYLGFVPACATSPEGWGGGTKVYAVFDPTMNYNEIRKTNTEFSPGFEIYHVNYNADYNPLRDGSSIAPFENINEALNAALRTDNITGNVEIYIDEDSTNPDTFYPFFSMNKTYKIYRADNSNNPLHSMGGLYVSYASRVIFNRGLTLTAGSITYNNGSICNAGNLYIDGKLSMSDGSQVAITGTDGSEMTCQFNETGGYDLSNFYGKLTNISNYYVSSNTFLTTRTLQPVQQMTTKVIGYRETLTETEVGNQTYQLPVLASNVLATVRFDLPNGSSGTNTTFESVITYTSGCYTCAGFTYQDTDNSIKILRVVIDTNGIMKFYNKPGGILTNVRVKACTTD